MPNPVEPPDKIQLDQDVYDVFIGCTKSISSFPEAYQEKLKVTYRFSATRFNSNDETKVNRTPDTLDIV